MGSGFGGKPLSSSSEPARPALADAELDRMWLQGNHTVLGELHRRYRKRLEAVAFRILRNHADAEDVVQRVFMALPRAAYRGSASLWSYLYRAASNGAVNVIRSRGRQERLRRQAAEGRAFEAPRPSNPEANVLEGEILAAVAKGLQSVKSRHRRILVLRIVHGLSNTEIAAREGVPLATVGTWLRRGREELRQELGPVLREIQRSER